MTPVIVWGNLYPNHQPVSAPGSDAEDISEPEPVDKPMDSLFFRLIHCTSQYSNANEKTPDQPFLFFPPFFSFFHPIGSPGIHAIGNGGEPYSCTDHFFR